MLKEKYSDKTVLIVTHDGVCRNIKRYFNGVPESGKLTEYSQKNCEIREYELGESYDI